MTDAELAALRLTVLWGAFALSAVLGAVSQRSHFCVMGAVSDVVSMGDWTRARMWLLAVAVAMGGFAVMQALGWVSAVQTLYGSPRLLWASHAVGGLLFGVGMVWASGCGAKTLVRLGGGNLKALVVLLVMGLSASMTLRGITAVARDASVDRLVLTLPKAQDVASLTGWPWIGLAVALALAAWALGLRGERRSIAWGAVVGLVVAGTWALTSRLAFVAEHPHTLEPAYLGTVSNRPEALSFVAPMAQTLEWLQFFSDRSRVLQLGIVTVLGVVLGAAAMALWRREFHWEGFRRTDDLVFHLVGAVLMGVGGVTALGCTVGQGLSGVSTLSLGSFIAVAGIVAGAVIGLRAQMAWLSR